MLNKKLELLLLEQSSDLVWMVNSKFLLTYANQAYLNLMKQITGKEKQLYESVLVEGFGESHIDKWTGYYVKALSGEHFEIEENYTQPITNEIKYGQIIFDPIRDEENKVIAVACQSRDITSVVKQRSEAHQLMDASLDVFCTIDEVGNFVFVSEAATQHWGFTPKELIGKPYVSFIIEEDIPKTNDIADAIISGEEIKSFVNRYKRKDGEIAYNQWSARWDNKAKLMYCVARNAKEKIAQESLLHQSEQRFKDLVQEGADLIAILDKNGNYLYVSPTSISILGMFPEEFIGRSPFEFIHPEDAEETLASLQKITKESKVKVAPFRFKNNKQEWRWIETILTNMLNNPAVNGIVANSRDITDHVTMLKERDANEQFNKTVIESSPDCLKILDNEGRLLYMNFNGLCQMEIDEFSRFRNQQWWLLWGKENEALVKESVEKALAGETVHFSAFCPTAKGTPKWWDVMVSPVTIPGEPIQKIVSISRDITVQKAEEQRLKLLESVIINTSDAVLITEAEPFDEPGPRIVYVNEAFTKMTGYTAEEVIGKTPRILQGPKSDKAELARLGKALRNWESCEITTINYKKNGEEFWINISLSPVADKTGLYTHWIAIERDVTDRKHIELEQRLLSEISFIFNEEKKLSDAALKLCNTFAGYGNYDFVEIWTPNLENTQIQLLSFSHHTQEAIAFYEQTKEIKQFLQGQGLPGLVWQTKKAQILKINEQSNEAFVRKQAAIKAGITAILGLPLLFNETVVGVLVFGTSKDVNSLHRYVKLFQRLETFIGSEINRKLLETNLQNLFEAIPDIICLIDFQGRFLKMNKAGFTLLGYDEEELLFHQFDKFVHPEDKHISTKEVMKISKGEAIFKFENRYITKSGEIVWLSWTCNSEIEAGLIYASAKNISNEKKLLELNKQSNQMAKIGSWEIDVQNNRLFWSDIVYELHETTPASFSPNLETAINLYRPDFRNFVQKQVQLCISEGKEFDFEAVLITLKNSERWIRAIGKADYVDGVCTRIFGSFQDIHDKKEASLRLQSVANNLPGVMFQYVIDRNGNDSLRYVSDGAKLIWGFDPEATMNNVNLVWNQIKAGGDFEEVQFSIAESIQTKTKWTAKWRYLLPGGELRVHSGYGTPEYLTDGSIVFNSLLLDVTEEIKNQELLNQASQMALIGSWELDLVNQTGDSMYWSPMTREILGVNELYNPTLTGGFEFYTNESKQRIQEAVEVLISEGKAFDEELQIITAKGNSRWIRCIGKGEWAQDKCVKIFGSFQDIHSTKSLELQLSEILGSISDAFYAVDKNWNFTFFNKEAENLLLKKAEEVIGKNMWQVLPAAIGTPLEEIYYRVASSGESESFEYFFPGDNEWYEINAYPSNGGVSAYFKNINERKQAAEILNKAYQEKTDILESIGDAFFTLDKNWNVTYWNKQCENLLGRKREDIINKNLWEEFADAINTGFYNQYHKAMKTGENVHLEDYYPAQDKWFDASAFPSEDRLTVYFRDVTARKKAELSLQQSNERFEKVTEATNDAIWDWDIEQNTFYRSKAIDNFFGSKTKKKLTKESFWEDRFHPEELPLIKESIKKAINDASASRWEMEYRILNDHKKIVHVMDRGTIIRNKQGKAIRMIGAMTNITERKEFEKQLIELNESLRIHTQELEISNEELEQFAFIASHDLQEPLRMISSFLDQLKRKYISSLDEKALQYINFSIEGSKRMKQIILDLLEYSRAGKQSTNSREMIDLKEVLADYKSLRKKVIAEKKAKIIAIELSSILSHKAPLIQTIHCLIDNAIKYSKESISPNIIISTTELENEWQIQVKDNGIGINPSYFEKIFIIFQRLHNRDQYGGTGIGLSIAKKHVLSWGGKIWLESTPGIGSTFYFTIPKN